MARIRSSATKLPWQNEWFPRATRGLCNRGNAETTGHYFHWYIVIDFVEFPDKVAMYVWLDGLKGFVPICSLVVSSKDSTAPFTHSFDI